MGNLENNQTIRTNLFNRLAIICFEDISPSEIDKTVPIANYCLNRDKSSVMNLYDYTILATIVQILSEAKKSRIGTYLFQAYSNPKGQELAKQNGFIIENTYDENDVKAFQESKFPEIWLPGDPDNIKIFADMFRLRIFQKSYTAFTWLGYYQNISKDVKVIKDEIRGRSDPMIIIWLILKPYLPSLVYETLMNGYFDISDNQSFITMATLLAIESPITFNRINLKLLVEQNLNSPIVTDLINRNYTFEVVPSTMDMQHTKDKFVNVEVLIYPEDPKYKSDILQYIYKNSS